LQSTHVFSHDVLGSFARQNLLLITNSKFEMEKNVILTTGIYDLIKDHIRRKKVTKEQEEILNTELKGAKQVLRKDLPENIVSVNRKIIVQDLTMNVQRELFLVGPNKAKLQSNKFSILGDIGLATVGHKVGDTVKWPARTGEKEYQILDVQPMY
jgi:regulator of nucleoside diphosphate kinase